VVVTLHDPTLAARYADRVLLLHGDGRWSAGATAELLTCERLGELYGTPMGLARVGDRSIFYAE
jgi:iron complex transport system ATP-binding protein